MITHDLPVAEWGRLPEDLGLAAKVFDQERSKVFVVEDQGRIVGQWAAIWLRHAEGIWIDPAHRGRGAVARRLWLAMQHHVRETGGSSILTAATSEDVKALLETHGALKYPQEYLLCL